MFFSQDILKRRGGKFGIVWIAATKGINLTRRDYYTVDLTETCDDIIRYITLQGDPLYPGGPRPRLSLYLSSQLMYGCVKVFNRQSDFLIADLVELNTKFRASLFQTVPIDLAPLTERAVHLQSVADVHGSPQVDPDFGKLRTDVCADMSLDMIPEVEVWQPIPEEGSPSRGQPDIMLPRTPPQAHRVSPPIVASFKPGQDSPLQARARDITLIETPSQPLLRAIEIPGETDLPPMSLEAMAEFGTSLPADEEPKKKRPRRASVVKTPLYTGSNIDEAEQQRHLNEQQNEFEDRLEAQQRIIDDILRRNEDNSQDLPSSEADILERERLKLQQMQQEFEESLYQAEFEAEMRQVESEQQGQVPVGATTEALGFYQPDALEPQATDVSGQQEIVDGIHLVQPATEATMLDDGRLAPTEETPAVLIGVPPEQIDLRPQPRHATPGVTPGSPVLPTGEQRKNREEYRLRLPAIEGGVPHTPRRRRQLQFADAEIKLPREAIYTNLRNGQATLKSNEIPDVHFRSVTNLFENPTRFMSKRLKRLWKRNTITKQTKVGKEDRSVWGVPGLLSSSESEAERTPLAQPLDDLTLSPVRHIQEEQLDQQQDAQFQLNQMPADLDQQQGQEQLMEDISGAERARDATRESLLQQESIEVARRERSRLGTSDITPDSSMLSKSRPDEVPDSQDRPLRKKGSPEDSTLRSTTRTPEVVTMASIQEEQELQASPVLPSVMSAARSKHRSTIDIDDSTDNSEIQVKLRKIIETNTEREDTTTFKNACPTNNYRKTAALMFAALLGLCKKEQVCLRQDQPYGDIFISRGARFHE